MNRNFPRVAVVGAGYAGLAACWHLQALGAEISLFDSRGIAGGASGVSTGLLHPYIGKRGRPAQRFEEAMAEASFLIDIAEKELGRAVALRTGIFRFAMTEEQRAEFSERGNYLDEERVQELFPEAVSLPGLWIPEGMTVFSKIYLEGLFQAVKSKGAQFFQEEIVSLDQLKEYDRLVLANGHEVLQFFQPNQMPLKTRKGQALICRTSGKPLPCSIIGEGHLSLMEDSRFCQLGSTYEDDFDVSKALNLREKIGVFFPPARTFEVVQIVSGVRIAQKNHTVPLLRQIDERSWVFTGLGSRGLLYHALFGKELAQKVLCC